MRNIPSPPLRPDFDTTVYVVLDDFGPAGRAYRETDEDKADLETLIRDLLAGQYEKPVRIAAFNTAEGWSRDVTEDVAREVSNRARADDVMLPRSTRFFVEWELGERVR
jgi:hypothetical protein